MRGMRGTGAGMIDSNEVSQIREAGNEEDGVKIDKCTCMRDWDKLKE